MNLTKKFIFLVCVLSTHASLTFCQSTITHNTQQKSKEVIVKRCITCGKVSTECAYKGNHPKCTECGSLIETCNYKGHHPKSYIVTINTLGINSSVYIEGYYAGQTPLTKSLKEGQYHIELKAANYDDLSTNIRVNEHNTNFKFTLLYTKTTKLGKIIETTQFADLGLPSKTLWACYDIGASSPEQIGSLYAWAETKTKQEYTFDNYLDAAGYTSRYSIPSKYHKYKHGSLSSCIGSDDDIATCLWGGGWQMPTEQQCNELINSCSIIFDEFRGIPGYTITGPNGKSIFFSCNNGNIEVARWSGELSNGKDLTKAGKNMRASSLTFHYNDYQRRHIGQIIGAFRCEGYPVRAVMR